MAEETSIESILDVLELIDKIERQTRNVSREVFLLDADMQDATAYRILAIGEASKDFGEDLKTRYPQVPWRQILGMRNLLAHEYFIRESGLIWETIQVGLPQLAEVCRMELGRRGYHEETGMSRAAKIMMNLPEEMVADDRQDPPPQDREGLDN
jgi:uncharacterized protein with HEPN domain